MTQRSPSVDPWRQFARKRGLRVVQGWGRLVEARADVLEGVVDDVALVVDTCMESSQDRFVLHTRVTGRAVRPTPLRLSIQSRMRAADGPDAPVSPVVDAELDERFLVNASDAAPARLLVDEELKRALLTFPDPLALIYGDGEARMFWEGAEREAQNLDHAADIVVQACRFRRGEGYR